MNVKADRESIVDSVLSRSELSVKESSLNTTTEVYYTVQEDDELLHLVNVYATECTDGDEEVYMAHLGETFNMALLDTGCTQSVCGNSWLEIYMKALDDEIVKHLKIEKSERSFKFGDGKVVRSKGKLKLPVYLRAVNKNISVETDIVDEDLPLLLSRSSMKRAGTEIRFNKDGQEEVYMFGKRQPVHLTSNGHICIPLTKYFLPKDDKCDKEDCEVLFTGNVDKLSTKEKKRIARKLHEQFAHASSKRLIHLLKDGGVDDKELCGLIVDIENLHVGLPKI